MPPPYTSPVQARVLIPVKAFAIAKLRLADALSAAERADLARSMAERVVAAAAPLPVAVACDDPDVAAWAEALGASVVWTPGRGLNGAVQQGVVELFEADAEIVIVAHGDLPHATGLARLADFDGVTLVPDRRDDGTNVVAIATSAAAFTFSYGVGSFARHVAEAERINASLRVARIPELQWDVDTPDDLREPIAT
ncbi:MAG: 2-phospho-L-lactate guanylyltransferase [Actinomycetota bacterium]|nr:2-phospho-L-lactate guanylyltransferase [Actinomycetota bacterium]